MEFTRTCELTISSRDISSTDIYGVHNTDETQENRIQAFHRETGQNRLTATLTGLQYGKYKDQNAFLIIVNFDFAAGSRLRYTYANLKLEFDDKYLQPKIATAFPWRIYSQFTHEERKRTSTLAIGLTTPSQSPLDASLTRESTEERKGTVQYRTSIEAYRYSSYTSKQPYNGVEWRVKANDELESFPTSLTCAAIVLHSSVPLTMQVNVEVEAVRQTWYNIRSIGEAWLLRGQPWDKNDPVHLNPGKEVPKALKIQDLDGQTLDKLSEEECRKITPVSDGFEVLPKFPLRPDMRQTNWVMPSIS